MRSRIGTQVLWWDKTLARFARTYQAECMFTAIIIFAALCVIVALADIALGIVWLVLGALCTVLMLGTTLGVVELAMFNTHNVFSLMLVTASHVWHFVF